MSGTRARPPTLMKNCSGLEHALADAHRARALEAGVAVDEGEPGRAAKPARQAVATDALHDRVLARLHLRHVDADRRVDGHAVVAAAARDVGGARAGDQRLGRDAAVVDAGAADQLALDERGLAAALREAHGERRPGLAGADDDGVEAFGHGFPSMGCALRARYASPRPARVDYSTLSQRRDRRVAPLMMPTIE